MKSVVNKVEISLPAKKNAEILAALEELMDNARGMVKHGDIKSWRVKRVGWQGSCAN